MTRIPLAVLCGALLCTHLMPLGAGAQSQTDYDLVFSSGANIFVMSADGSDVKQLTDTEADLRPIWSSDRTRIAFDSNRSGSAEIYIMNAEGTQTVRLTDFEGADSHAKWSPAGSRLAFVSQRDALSRS